MDATSSSPRRLSRLAMRFVVGFVLWLAALGVASAQAPGSDSEPVGAARVADLFTDAIANGDRAAVEALLAPSALIFKSGEAESSAKEYLERHLPTDIAFMRHICSARHSRARAAEMVPRRGSPLAPGHAVSTRAGPLIWNRRRRSFSQRQALAGVLLTSIGPLRRIERVVRPPVSSRLTLPQRADRRRAPCSDSGAPEGPVAAARCPFVGPLNLNSRQ
jgi:hypothetical protein